MKLSPKDSNYPGILLNFRIPPSLKSDFQHICRNQHISMTARLNLMVNQFVNEARSQPKNVKQPPEHPGDTWRDHLYG